MKAVIALLIGASAVRLDDAPPYFNEPTWGETSPSAAGFVQVSACHSSGVAGVTCAPQNHELFATGMNGDEDLGEDIAMKGDKFHFVQQRWNPVVVESTGPLPKGQMVSTVLEKSALELMVQWTAPPEPLAPERSQ